MRAAQIATLIVVFSTSINFLYAFNSLKAVVIRHRDQNALAQYRVSKTDGHIIQTGDLTSGTESRTSSPPSPLVSNSFRWFTTSIDGQLSSLGCLKTREGDTSVNFAGSKFPSQEKTVRMDLFLAMYQKLVIDQLSNGTGENLLSLHSVTIMNHDEPVAIIDEVDDEVSLTIPDWASNWFLTGSFRLANEEFDFVVKLSFQRALSGVFFKELINMFANAPEDSVAFYASNSVHAAKNPLVEIIGFRTSTYGEALIFTLVKEDLFGVEFFMVNGVLAQFVPRDCSSENTIFTLEEPVQWMVEFSLLQAEHEKASNKMKNNSEIKNDNHTEIINNIEKNKVAW